MDYIVVAGLKALVKYKDAIEEAKEQVEKARQLASKIEMFELTLTMISMRGVAHDDYPVKPTSETDARNTVDEKKNESFNMKDAVSKLAEQVKDKAIDLAKFKVSELIDGMSPIGKFILTEAVTFSLR